MSGVSALPGIPSAKVDQLSVPDLFATTPTAIVAKKVNFKKDLIGVAKADPNLKVVYILRHPCGQIASYMTGLTLGKMPRQYLPHKEGMAYVFPNNAVNLDNPSQMEILCYRWAVFNQLLIDIFRDAPNVRTLRYEDLCADPIGVAQSLFEWAELPWSRRAEAFLQSSIGAETGGGDYHALTRQPLEAANKWRREMKAEDIKLVMSICRHSSAMSYFDDDKIFDLA